MRAALLLALAAVLVAPLGQAGSESSPDVNDPEGDAFDLERARPDLDINRVWFERSGNQFKVTVTYSEIAELEPESIYAVFFSAPTQGRRYVSMTVTASGEPSWGTGLWQGRPDDGECSQATDPYEMYPTTKVPEGSFEAGSPAYVRWNAPLKDMGLTTGDQLRSMFAFTYIPEDECKRATDLTGYADLWTVPDKPNFLQRLIPGFEVPALLFAAAASLAAVGRRK